MNSDTNWEIVIGLEVHLQLATQSKMFSGAPTAFGAEPNSQACMIDLGFPGVLPVPNRKAIEMAIKFGLSIKANIAKRSIFDRKNYFYPDLPKGYQITQQHCPIIRKGGALSIHLEGETPRNIRIHRAHLEEDAGKSVHDAFPTSSAIDLNRAGNPLLEIVSEPDLRSAKEAVAYLKTLHTLVRYLEISDANMQEGSFRCDANVSVRKKGSKKLGVRCEIKNLNSFRFIERAINYEAQRHIHCLENGQPIHMETRLYDPDNNETRMMRKKEEIHSYRYFRDPDLLPVVLEETFIRDIKSNVPELPWEKKARFQSEHQLSDYDADVLTGNRPLAAYYEATLTHTTISPKITANWVIGALLAALNKANCTIEDSKVSPEALAALLNRIQDNTISGKIAKTVFETMWETGAAPDAIIAEKGLQQMTDTGAIEKIIDQVIQDNPTQVADFRAGKEKIFAYLIGQVMKATQGKANPQQLNTLLKQQLNNTP